ncbi:hypothetical protein GCM10022198_12010 [Klugiella xanthotipulae]|uniref:non-specific serine/threonine protein kinase n=1 Tax=Klugiella xanthotipulae TaxID=244735 RepID=A0A543I4R6_9MICO|nr:serine/threonine-protein kinase [Klugiella xanthotipulae]TQM65559.1 serine/threonine-protein kinase [Klugiella xanthotipulae]
MQSHQGDALGASYRLVERIGSGAAGDVWLATSTSAGAHFAAKILKAEHANDPALVERFIRERSVLLGLRHSNIVTVRDLVVEGSTLAIVMDYVPGGSLRDLLDNARSLPAADALTLGAQVFEALASAHAAGVVHRDIKPDNVLLAEHWHPGQSGTVRVTDFGIASVVSERNRQTTGILGTPQYMAPELISHGQSTSAADVYSAGILLYELIAGRTPFAGPGTDFTIAYRHVTVAPPRLDVPPAMWDFLTKLLDKNPRNRPSAAEAAATARRLARENSSLPALPVGETVQEFVEEERHATVLRSDLLATPEHSAEPASTLSAAHPELGESGQRTVLRPLPRREAPLRSPTEEPTTEKVSRRPSWLTNRAIVLGGAGVLLIGVLIVGVVWLFPGGTEKPPAGATESATAQQQDPTLPTGLGVARTARYDATEQTVSLDITYSAQKAPLSGSLLEVIPAVGKSTACPAVSWEQVSAAKHQSSTTGMTTHCGWELTDITIPANGTVTVTATLPAETVDAAGLNEWLAGAATATAEALNDPAVTSPAYPAQRLQSINVVTPPRTTSQTPLPITLVPVWPSGPDELNPLYQSPSSGTPSQMLQNIAGGEKGIRFSDNCSGTVAISSDGLVVTALSITPTCTLFAQVGNFTDLQSSPFSITTRE